MDTLLILMLALSALAWQQATCQFVEPRAANEKMSPASVSTKGAVYQRHLSPHRMMHFGKRPIYQAAPILLAPGPTPTLYQNTNPDDSLLVNGLQFFPNLVSLSLERGQTVQPLIPDEAGSLPLDASQVDELLETSSGPLSGMRYVVDSLPQAAATTDFLYPSEKPFNSHLRARATAQQMMSNRQQYQPQVFNAKLMSSDEREPSDKRSFTSGSGSASRASVGFLTKYTNALPFIKKADTKDNFFMHFGRK